MAWPTLATPFTTFVLLSRAPNPLRRELSVMQACRTGELLACAFATWLPKLEPQSSNIALLVDCDGVSDPISKPPSATSSIDVEPASESKLALMPSQWTSNVRAQVVSRCLRGGVCFRHRAGFALQCYRGSAALLGWLHSDASFKQSAFFIKVDTDAVADPSEIARFLSTLPPDTRMYVGNGQGSYGYSHCQGELKAGPRSKCSSAWTRRPCGPFTCLRSTSGWAALEQSIVRDDPFSAAALKTNRSLPVNYAAGGTYILSSALVAALAKTRCVQRVANIDCHGWSNEDLTGCEHSPRHEDAAVGLCAYLNGATRVLDNRCFVRHTGHAYACKRPLSIHPIKDPKLYVAHASGIEHNAAKLAANRSKGHSSTSSRSRRRLAEQLLPRKRSVDELRKDLAAALIAVWEAEDATGRWPPASACHGPCGRVGPSTRRSFVESVVHHLGQYLPIGDAAHCLDWSLKYLRLFKGCKAQYNYRYDAATNVFQPPSSTRGAAGLVQGDLANLSHVPSARFDLVLTTEVFEHVPYFWRAFRQLQRIVKPRGYLVLTVPFFYEFHLSPGDYWRMTPMAVYHLLESNGFAICRLASDGLRAAQMTALGFTFRDVPEKLVRVTRPKTTLYDAATGWAVLAQRVADDAPPRGGAASSSGGRPTCDQEALKQLPPLTNQIDTQELIAHVRHAKGVWPAPNPGAFNFS